MKFAVVTSADDAFALPATVMIRSLVDHLDGAAHLEVYVLDCGLSASSRRKMRRSIPRVWARIQFVPIRAEEFKGFRVDGHISAATYARLLIGQSLPDTIDRAIYIDGDMLLLSDLRGLWETDLRGHPLAAVQDPVAGRVGQSAQMMHWEGWDVPAGTRVFNAGLMLIDLKRWRKEGLFERAIHVAREHPDRMRFWDQCALNYVIRGDFEVLHPSWNVLPHLYYPPHSLDVIYEKETVSASIKAPKILHFSGGYRPWKGPARHWLETEFYRYLYRTAWRKDVYCAPWMERGNTIWTKVKRVVKQILKPTSRLE